MLSLNDDQINSAHEQVFGYKFSCYAPQPPNGTATHAQRRPPSSSAATQHPRRPPRPPGPDSLRPQRPPSARNTPAAPRLQRPSLSQQPRRRIIFSDRKAPSAAVAVQRRRHSSNATEDADSEDEEAPDAAAATASVEDEEEAEVEASISTSISSDLTASPIPLSGTQSKRTSNTRGSVRDIGSTSQLSAYYEGRPKSQSKLSESKGGAPPRSPLPPPPPPPLSASRPSSASYVRPTSATVRSENSFLRRAQPEFDSAHTCRTPPPPPQPTSRPLMDTSGMRSGAETVFDRLAGDAACGTTTLGKRVLQWARVAGLSLNPSPSAWRALHLYATAPLRHERLWRRTCAKARHQLSQFAQTRLGLSSNKVAASTDGSREHSVTHVPAHADPHNVASTKRTPHGRSQSRPAPSNPSSTPGGLRAFRCREEYKRWCYWQLCRFYELGSSYVSSVWRMAPISNRRHPSAGNGGSSGGGCSNVSPVSVLSDLFDGRYRVPCAATIDETLGEYREQNSRARTLMRLLLHENASNAEARANADEEAARRRGADHGDREEGDSDGAESQDGDEEHNGDDVYRTLNESRRSSDAVSATEPYCDVRMDHVTGLLHLSFYANGDAGGNGADFLGSCVAACLDNTRWIILKGLWARQVLVFHFHRAAVEEDEEDGRDGGRAGGDGGKSRGAHLDEDRDRFNEQEEQYVSRRSQVVDGFVIKGVAFAKAPTEHAAVSERDAFVCSRCGRLRRSHNEAYISKRTGQLVRGYYYCVLCQRRTHHVRLPPLESLQEHYAEALSVSAAREATADAARAGESPSVNTPASARLVTASLATTLLGRSPVVLPSPTPSRGRLFTSSNSAASPDVEVAARAVREWTRVSAAAARPAWQSGHKLDSDRIFCRPRGLDCPPPKPFY